MGFFKKSKKENTSRPTESGDIHANRGLRALDINDNNLAVTELEQAIKLGLEKYDLAEIYTVLGRTYKNLGKLDEAVAAHKKSLEINPDYEKAWNNLGATYMALNQYAEAERCMERAVECDPTYVFALASLGAVYIKRDKADKAVDILKKATALIKKMSAAHANLAHAYAKVGRFAEARQALEQAKVLGYANWQAVQKLIDAEKTKALKPAARPKGEGVYPIETIRVELERVRIIIGDAGDYLDRGRPNPEERARTEAAIREHEERKQALETEFNALLDDYRQKNPAIVEAWVQLHLEILEDVIAETDTTKNQSRDDSVRLHVATKTVEEWQEVLAGKRNYVLINHYFMKDYNERLLKKMPELNLKPRR